MRFVLTARDPAAGWNPPTTGPTNHGQVQTLLRYRPRNQVIDIVKYLVCRVKGVVSVAIHKLSPERSFPMDRAIAMAVSMGRSCPRTTTSL